MIKLTDQMRKFIGSALADQLPLIASSVDDQGQPTISFYGSAQVHSSDQLAIWVRNPEAGLLNRIPSNPRMAFLYRNPIEKLSWQFYGQARVLEAGEESQHVYEHSPEPERNRDPEKLGCAVVIDIERVTARGTTLMKT